MPNDNKESDYRKYHDNTTPIKNSFKKHFKITNDNNQVIEIVVQKSNTKENHWIGVVFLRINNEKWVRKEQVYSRNVEELINNLVNKYKEKASVEHCFSNSC